MTTGEDFGCSTIPHGPNVIVLTNAGKTIFCRYGDVDSIAHLTATVQLITDIVKSDDDSIHSIHTDCSIIAFMNIRSLSLIAMERVNDQDNHQEVLPFLKLLLELTYQHFLFLLSNCFQTALENSPGIDLQLTLGSSFHKSVQNLLNRALPLNNCAPLQLACGIEAYGIPYKIRDDASRILCEICGKTPGTLLGMLSIGSKLVTITQGEWTNHIIGASDVVLLLEFVDSLSSKSFAELWFPSCLPNFDSSCFFHVYVKCLDSDSNVVLILVSPFCETSQFHLFTQAATEIKERLGFFPKETTNKDIPNTAASQFLEEASLLTCTKRSFTFASALANNPREYVYAEVRDLESVFHFTFRFDSNWKGSDCCLTQCITSETLESENLKLYYIWAMYRQLSLELRLGSSSTDSFLQAIKDSQNDSPCRYLLESPLYNKSGQVFIESPDGTVFVGLCDKNFELYATFIGGVDHSRCFILARKVADKLKKASQNLFLNQPKRFRAHYK